MNFNYCSKLTVRVLTPLQRKELELKCVPKDLRCSQAFEEQGCVLLEPGDHRSLSPDAPRSCLATEPGLLGANLAHGVRVVPGNPTRDGAFLRQPQLPHPQKSSGSGLQTRVGSRKTTEGCPSTGDHPCSEVAKRHVSLLLTSPSLQLVPLGLV